MWASAFPGTDPNLYKVTKGPLSINMSKQAAQLDLCLSHPSYGFDVTS